MKRTLPLLSLLVLACPVAAQTNAPTHTPLRPASECLRPDRINEWLVINARTALVRTGPEHYVVKLQSDCPRLGIGPTGLLFRANQSHRSAGQGEICGEVGETVRSRDQPPCAIASVEKIDKARFQQMSEQAIHHGTGADQPPRP